jgi:hypothetical protein
MDSELYVNQSQVFVTVYELSYSVMYCHIFLLSIVCPLDLLQILKFSFRLNVILFPLRLLSTLFGCKLSISCLTATAYILRGLRS